MLADPTTPRSALAQILGSEYAAAVWTAVLLCQRGVPFKIYSGCYEASCLRYRLLQLFSSSFRGINNANVNPTLDAFHPSCPPTFIAATCPEILRIPPRVYPRLLEPASSVSSFYKQMMKCWHPDKIHFHPNQAAADTFAKDVRVILALCRDRMSLGKLYPRSIWSRGRREHIEIDQSGLWNAGTLDLDLDSILNLGLNSSLDSHSNFVDSKFSFPQSTKPCICDMDTAVSNLLRSPFTPPWSTFYTTKKPFPRTMEQLVDYCACDIQTAWSPFQHIFNISIVSPRIIQYTLLPSWIHFIQGFDIPQDLQIALGWVVLKANVPWLRPLSLALSIFLPVPTIQSFHTLHLPPRGIHQFWLDRSLRGLPPDSMRKISVPSAWTDELRHYGCDGADEYNEVGTRRKNLSDHEKLACKKKGWCFRGEFGDWDY
jgi:hypothetical protein